MSLMYVSISLQSTFDDECQDGQCGGTPVNCDDDNPCTNDSCNQFLGCVNIPNVDVCEADGNVWYVCQCYSVHIIVVRTFLIIAFFFFF